MPLILTGTAASTTLDSSAGLTFSDSSNQSAAASPYVLKNRIINGAMMIDQRNAGASVSVASGSQFYSVDRFWGAGITSSQFNLQQDSNVPSGAGFIYSLKATVITAITPSSTNQARIVQSVEGLNVADLMWGTANAKTVTLSFWVRSSLTGTFSGSLMNSAADRSYPYTYTISSADTWEYKTVTIAGDTTGTWLTTNGVGINVEWSLGAGSSRSGTANTWQAGRYHAATGAVAPITTSSATFYITGVQLEVGSTATPFERRLYNQELANCQRYYYKIQATGSASFFGSSFNNTTTGAQGLSPFPVQMRVAPTALEQSGTAGDYSVNIAGSSVACSSVPTFSAADVWNVRTLFTVASGLTAGQASQLRSVSATAYLGWSAEL